MESAEGPSATDPIRLKNESIWGPSFQGLLWTNWLTTINDNAFRWFVIGVGKYWTTADKHSDILTLGTICFVLPYLVFAVPSGWLADRFSKRQVIVGCKVAEIVFMALGLLALYVESLPLLLTVLFLLGIQSTLFAPAKVGTIPELLDERKISAGNGLFNLATLTATVIGMSLGGWLADATKPYGEHRIWLTAMVFLGIAVVGTAISFFIRKLPAGNPSLRFDFNIFGAMIKNLGELYRNARLFRVALGVVFFWSFAALAQVNIDSFGDESGSLLEQERTPLLVSLILGVGLGSVFAGYFSRGRIELGLVPWATMGMTFFCILLYFAPGHFMFDFAPGWQQFVACAMLGFLGMSAGFFDVPISSYLQDKSPPKSRGAILAASNFLLFAGVIASSLLFNAMRYPSGKPDLATLPDQYRAGSFGGEDRQAITSTVEEFLRATKSDPAVTEKQFIEPLKSLPQNLQTPAFVEMAFEDMRRQAKSASGFDLTVYNQVAQSLQANSSESSLRQAKPDERLVKAISRAAVPQPFLTSREIFLTMGILTIPVMLYAIYRLSREMATVGFYWLVRFLYRLRVHGLENVPESGPVVFIANHSSWLDATLMMLSTPRRVRLIAWAGNFTHWFMKWFGNFAGAIMISGGPKSILRGIQEARKTLDDGAAIGMFPEGGISRTVQVKGFKPGLMKIIENSDVPVVPMYFDELWGTIFSYSGGKALVKLPKYFRKGLSVHIGKPVVRPEGLHELRQKVQLLGAEAVNHRTGRFESPARMFISCCRRRLFTFKTGDSTGQKMSGGQLLMRTLILRRLLRKFVLKDDEKNVGVLIPPSVGGVVVNMALALDRRVSANLNYTVSSDIMNHCIQDAQIRHVLTTEKVLEKLEFDLGEKKTLLDELRKKVSLADKLICAIQAFVLPGWLLAWHLGVSQIKPNDLLTLIFTSGSTGKPKGVMLTQQNISSNVLAIEQVICLNSSDVISGVLPFFHSFGYTISLWGAMGLNIAGTYHFSPLDARLVGKLVDQFKGTVLLATPTFLRNYMKRCTPEEFKSLQIVVVGAEKMPIELASEFEKKFGVRPVEGYGSTELSPLVSVNVPESRRLDKFQVDCKEGTVGRPIPNVVAKITDLDTGRELGPNESGMLWIKGPNVMAGYLNHPEKTAEVIVDGWYNTGDVGLIDDDGFIKLTGRMSRFSKIGGEMVPHVTIEEELMRLMGDNDGQQSLAVTSVPDSRKGERLIVFHTGLSKSIDEMRSGLSACGLPNLFIPSNDSFIKVDTIPVLGTGKLDLKGLKELALRLCSEKASD